MLDIESPLAGRRVLVVENEYFLAEELRQGLEVEKAEVLGPVPRVADALRLLARERRPDLAILDVNLEGGMVFPLANVLAAQGVPFVFATTYDRQDLPPAYAHVPNYGKPLDVRTLAWALGREAAAATFRTPYPAKLTPSQLRPRPDVRVVGGKQTC